VHFAASTVAFHDPDWDQRLEELAQAGCELVELTAAFGPGAREGATFDYMDPYAVERAGRALERSGLRLHSMHGPMMLLPPSRLSPFGPAGLEGVLEAERAACDAVMAMGGRFVVTQDIAELEPEDEPHLASPGPLSELADYAAERGCVFCIENGAEDARGFERLVRAVEELAHPGLGICLDTGHAQLWNYCDVPRSVAACGTALRSCHVHDNLGSSDAHLVAGDGIVPWAAVLRGLADVAYRGPLVVEMYSGRRGEDPGAAVRASAEFIVSAAGEACRPEANACGFGIFRATEADRERATLVMGPLAVPSPPEDDAPAALIAVDRFGDPAAWGALARDGGETRLAISFRGAEDAEVARAMVGLLVETSDGAGDASALRAEGAAADALVGLGYEGHSGGCFARPGPAGKATS
jgi:sugar phosphate isomerase/epimerase